VKVGIVAPLEPEVRVSGAKGVTVMVPPGSVIAPPELDWPDWMDDVTEIGL